MTHLRRKLLTATLAIGLAVSLLAWAGLKEGWVYSMSVDDFVAAGTPGHGQRVRLHGTAGESDFDVSHGGLWANFNIHGSQQVLRVAYQGVIPDMFHPGHDVIIEGRLDAEGTFRADTLMTKCGSRYESEPGTPGMPHADPRATAGDPASGDRGMAS
ncbi:MAG: cytochrome c maturation protein CcmE [Phycisphaeraceae bacterium]|nr:cytochrome c maturation protein CcmE [Phycisphaeraceae bacterium]